MKHTLIIWLSLFGIVAASQRTKQPKQITAVIDLKEKSLQPKKVNPVHVNTIIIAWCSIFEPDENDIERRVKERLGLLRSIGLLFKGIPKKEEIKKQLFSILGKIPVDPTELQKTDYPSWETDYQLPPIFEQHLLTNSAEQEQTVYQKVNLYLEETAEIPESRERILKGLADFIFQSELMNQSMEPVQHMVDLFKKLKEEGYSLILVGNVPGYAWDQFLEKFKEAKIVKELFLPQNMYISGKEKKLKTSKEMYEKIIKNHNLTPSQTFVIECNKHNLKYPLERGMKTAVFSPQKSDFSAFKQEVQKIVS